MKMMNVVLRVMQRVLPSTWHAKPALQEPRGQQTAERVSDAATQVSAARMPAIQWGALDQWVGDEEPMADVHRALVSSPHYRCFELTEQLDVLASASARASHISLAQSRTPNAGGSPGAPPV